MPLDEYRRKRDFRRTPEPSGEAGQAAPAAVVAAAFPGWDQLPQGRRFCVQMHHASRLHFDLRLEHAGVLLSWAVPKGPTLDAGVRRLAVHVEDHPIEYGEFEGVIPSGYGAGTVMLWDAGTVSWVRESAPDPEASLRRGDLKFSLDGVKLHGEFALVRLGRRAGGRRAAAAQPEGSGEQGNEWLLIKKRDAAVIPGMEAADLDISVLSGRSLAEIAADATQTASAVPGGPVGAGITESVREGAREVIAAAPERRIPSTLRPMLATPLDAPFSRPGWLFEMKYDGVRALARVRDGAVSLRGRSGRDETARFPELGALGAALDLHEAVVDGELVALDAEGRPSFELLQQRINVSGVHRIEQARAQVPAAYYVFDILGADGHDLRDLPLLQRKHVLRAVLRDSAVVHYADHVGGDGEALFAAVAERGVEGVVAKRGDSRYEGGRRSHAWLKVRAWSTQDCAVCGVTSGRRGRGDIGALVLGVLVDSVLTHAGQVGSGLDEAALRYLRARLPRLAIESCPFPTVPSTDTKATWVRPELVASVRHMGWTRAGTLRQPTFRGWREDLRLEDCTREAEVSLHGALQAMPPPAPSAAAAPSSYSRKRPQQKTLLGSEEHAEALERLHAMGTEGQWEIAGRRLRLTNLDKPLWPAEGITKRDMIAYYVRLAPLLLTHLRDRPLGMQVFPDGIEGKHFWRKRIPEHAPKWMRSWAWQGERKQVDYIVVEEVATLAWIANSGVIDLHPWHSRIDAPEQPDWAVFDLDPFPPATFADVLAVARLVAAALDHYRLRGLPKLSGQTGLQIYLPLQRGPGYEQVRDWVEQVGRAIGSVARDKVTWEWTVAKRSGRLRIDYTQNVIGKTLAAPYSLRPAPGAPASAPVTWEELEQPGIRPDQFTIATMEARIREVGDLFAPVLDGGQRLPPL